MINILVGSIVHILRLDKNLHPGSPIVGNECGKAMPNDGQPWSEFMNQEHAITGATCTACCFGPLTHSFSQAADVLPSMFTGDFWTRSEEMFEVGNWLNQLVDGIKQRALQRGDLRTMLAISLCDSYCCVMSLNSARADVVIGDWWVPSKLFPYLRIQWILDRNVRRYRYR